MRVCVRVCVCACVCVCVLCTWQSTLCYSSQADLWAVFTNTNLRFFGGWGVVRTHGHRTPPCIRGPDNEHRGGREREREIQTDSQYKRTEPPWARRSISRPSVSMLCILEALAAGVCVYLYFSSPFNINGGWAVASEHAGHRGGGGGG